MLVGEQWTDAWLSWLIHINECRQEEVDQQRRCITDVGATCHFLPHVTPNQNYDTWNIDCKGQKQRGGLGLDCTVAAWHA